MKNTILFLAIIGVSSLTQAKELKIFSASTVYTNIFSKIENEFEKKTGIKLVYVNDPKKSSNAVDNLKTVLDDKAEAGVTSIPFEDWITTAKKNGLKVDNVQLSYRVIGKDVIEVIAHKDIGVKNLKLADLEKIFTGKVTNWKEVGGKDVPVKLFYQKRSVARNTVFQKKVMPKGDFHASIQDIENFPDLTKKISTTPGSISFLATEQVTGDLLRVDTDEEIMRPITIINKGRPSAELLKLVEFINGDGKALLNKK